jgi:hypothetical protein
MVGEFELELAGNNLESVPLCNGSQRCLNSYGSRCMCRRLVILLEGSFVWGWSVLEDGISENNLKRRDMELDDCLGTSEAQPLRIA